MNRRISVAPVVTDPRLPGVQSLLGSDLPAPVGAVLDSVGSRLDEAVPIQVMWAPGRRMTVRYRVRVIGGSLSGRRQVVATVGYVPEGAVAVDGPDGAIGLWVVPHDPLLPGLASALDAPTVDGLLSDLGIGGRVKGVRLRSYRPGRRGVVEVEAGDSSIYLKVVPLTEAEALHHKHRFLAQHLPVPDSLGFSRDLGVVVLPAMSGVNLRTILREGASDLPAPGSLAGMLAAIPVPPGEEHSRSPIEQLPGTIRLLRGLLPDESDRLDDLELEIGVEDLAPTVPVHGDFHEAQVMVAGGEPVGLLDVDTFGLGRPGDDPATMLGHLALLAPECADPGGVLQMALSLNRIWDRRLDPADLRRRTAAVVLGLAGGPFRVQRPKWPAETRHRISVAEQWVGSARRLDEKDLISSSGTSHVGREP